MPYSQLLRWIKKTTQFTYLHILERGIMKKISVALVSLIDWDMVDRKRSGLKVFLSITELGIEALTGINVVTEGARSGDLASTTRR